jgi:hypothetical protein
MLPKDLVRFGDPRLVVPHLCFGSMPSPVGCENHFYFEFGKPLHDIARTPDQSNRTTSLNPTMTLQEPIELVVALAIIF